MFDREILNELSKNNYYKQLKSNNVSDTSSSSSSRHVYCLPTQTIMRNNEQQEQEQQYKNNNIKYENNFQEQQIIEMDYYEQQQQHQQQHLHFYNNKQLVLKTKLEKRNARERKRVQQVNLEFQKLRKLLINKSFEIKKQQEAAQKQKQQQQMMMDHSSDDGCIVDDDDDDDCDDDGAEIEHGASFKKLINSTNPNKRISKVKTLRCAIEYIRHLQKILADDNCEALSSCSTSVSSAIDSHSSSLDISLCNNNNDYHFSQTAYTTAAIDYNNYQTAEIMHKKNMDYHYYQHQQQQQYDNQFTQYTTYYEQAAPQHCVVSDVNNFYQNYANNYNNQFFHY